MDDMGGMAMPMDDGAPGTPAPGNGPAPHPSQQVPQDCCSCIAACYGVATVPLSAHVAWIETTPASSVATINDDSSLAPSAAGVVLPFANGPPGAVAAA
jgi:hypothetical protein